MKNLLVGLQKKKTRAVRKGHVLPCFQAWPVPVSTSMQTNSSKMILLMLTTT